MTKKLTRREAIARTLQVLAGAVVAPMVPAAHVAKPPSFREHQLAYLKALENVGFSHFTYFSNFIPDRQWNNSIFCFHKDGEHMDFYTSSPSTEEKS